MMEVEENETKEEKSLADSMPVTEQQDHQEQMSPSSSPSTSAALSHFKEKKDNSKNKSDKNDDKNEKVASHDEGGMISQTSPALNFNGTNSTKVTDDHSSSSPSTTEEEDEDDGDGDCILSGQDLFRSVRWRIQMGLLKFPASTNKKGYWTMSEIDTYNQTELADSRRYFQQLQENYQDEMTEMILLDPSLSSSSLFADFERIPLSGGDAEKEEEVKVNDDHDDHNTSTRGRKSRRRSRGSFVNDGSVLLVDFGGRTLSLDEDDDGSVNSTSEHESHAHTLALIQKDLLRLQPEHHHYCESSFQQMLTMNAVDPAEQEQQNNQTNQYKSPNERLDQIRQMLYFYSREHHTYQQGQHELASLVLMVMELDCIQASPSVSSSSFTTKTSGEESSDQNNDNSDDNSIPHIVDPDFVLHDAYALFCALLRHLQPTYNGQAMDIMSKLQYVCNDFVLEHYVRTEIQKVPQELLFARWMRLCFSREVDRLDTLWPLWDLFWDLTSVDPSVLSFGSASQYTRPRVRPPLRVGKLDWMTVLEITCAAYIWMQRKSFLGQQEEEEEGSDEDSEDGNDSNLFGILMNGPPMTSCQRLMATVLSSLRRHQHDVVPVAKRRKRRSHNRSSPQIPFLKSAGPLWSVVSSSVASGITTTLSWRFGFGNNNNNNHNAEFAGNVGIPDDNIGSAAGVDDETVYDDDQSVASTWTMAETTPSSGRLSPTTTTLMTRRPSAMYQNFTS